MMDLIFQRVFEFTHNIFFAGPTCISLQVGSRPQDLSHSRQRSSLETKQCQWRTEEQDSDFWPVRVDDSMNRIRCVKPKLEWTTIALTCLETPNSLKGNRLKRHNEQSKQLEHGWPSVALLAILGSQLSAPPGMAFRQQNGTKMHAATWNMIGNRWEAPWSSCGLLRISQGARYNMHRFGISVARSTHPPMELKSGSRESHLTTVLRKVSILIRSNSKAPPDNNPALCFYSILQQPWHSCWQFGIK